jgi:hypothetical protein
MRCGPNSRPKLRELEALQESVIAPIAGKSFRQNRVKLRFTHLRCLTLAVDSTEGLRHEVSAGAVKP